MEVGSENGPWHFACFHSTKEGFKDGGEASAFNPLLGFHSTKEGFKVNATILGRSCLSGFHSTKEGFKVNMTMQDKNAAYKFPFH